MLHGNRTYTDLAEAVRSVLRKRKLRSPDLDTLINLFGAMYYASLQTEESEPISFHIVYLDPNNPDPNPPSRITNDRWIFVQLEQPIEVNIANLIKIAKASDPRTSSFAIYSDLNGKLFVWGLVDQGNSYSDFVNYESESGFPRPGMFQASIGGIGHLIAFIGMEKIGELKVNKLITNVLDVLSGGPLHDALIPGITTYLNSVKRSVPARVYQARSYWDESVKSLWIESLCRLLLRIQNYRHGGAILITGSRASKGLKIKYNLRYGRLGLALRKRASLQIEETFASDQIWEEFLSIYEDDVPATLYLDETVARNELDDNRRELDSTIWFISLLTRVDGLVLLNPSLDVRGFGVEITYTGDLSKVFLAGNRSATKAKLRRLDFNHYGTRHRSMMRYCSKMPGSVGFVISQDGDVRAMTQVRGSLVMWDNIKLQLPDFVRRTRLRTAKS
jgi:hypothetical protein